MTNQLDLEVSIKAQDYIEQGHCGQEAYDLAEEELFNEITEELSTVNREIDILEYGDDLLYTNGNGNYPRFKRLEKRKDHLISLLKGCQKCSD